LVSLTMVVQGASVKDEVGSHLPPLSGSLN
jgi:hypothetical protein